MKPAAVLGHFVVLAALCLLPCHAQEPAPQVAITFDDLPAHGPLAPGQARRDVIFSILATLQHEHLPPVYGFINGYRMDHHPYQIELLQAWHAAGEPLGNHTYSHEELDVLSLAQFERDVKANEPILRRLDPGADWRWFRYPYMEEGETVAKRAAARDFLLERGYQIAEVSLDFQDYRWNDAYGICAAKHDVAAIEFLRASYLAAADHALTTTRELSHTLYGRDIAYILLLHVGSFDARMFPELVALLRSRGVQFTTLEQAASDPVYAADLQFAVKGGGTFLEVVAQSRNVTIPPDPDVLAKVDGLCHPRPPTSR